LLLLHGQRNTSLIFDFALTTFQLAPQVFEGLFFLAHVDLKRRDRIV